MLLRPLFLLIAAALPALLLAQPAAPLPLLHDDPMVARLDELAALPWLKNSPLSADTLALNVHGYPPTYIPAFPEATYQDRLQYLDGQTPFDLVYNGSVQAYIDLYAVRKREMTSRMLGLSDLYFPVFEEYLDRYGMPLEMKYLAVVESALNPAARSRAGAVGLWQFMLPTGKMFGLKADSYVDERHDLHKSTEAACKYLTYLYNMYDNWEMALAAYNCGPGNVNKAIRRSGGHKDYWKIYDHLPRETRGYVPAFIAVNYVFAHAADHNLYPVVPTYCAHQVDTVQVCYPVDLGNIAPLMGSTAEELKELNPTFKLGVIPDVDQPVTLYLPKQAAGVFVNNEDSLRYAALNEAAAPATEVKSDEGIALQSNKSSVPRYHTVRRGESLGVIAQRYHTSVTDLKRLNNIRGTTIHTGEKLKVGYTTQQVSAIAPKTDGQEAFIYYEVQPGDTLWDIAQRYPGVSVDDLKRMNTELEKEGLKPGRKIKVGTPQG
ncbi:MAG: LysM peptidoglycan-binding domain-containing protein [Flavobacteriales bacterium]|nr:LysM peptidoglycan-binding domain-containing protein [Flavobacteriales bacterium]